MHGLYCAGVETQCLYALEICNFGGDNEIWREANSLGERWFWDKRGLKLRVPGQFKKMKRKTKPPVCCFFFKAGVKNRDCASHSCQSVLHSRESDFAPEPELSKAGPCTFQALHKGRCTPLRFPLPPSPFQASDISGGVVAAPLSQSQTRCALRSTLELPKALFVSGTKRRFWLGRTRSASGEERRICGASHKTFLQSDSPPVQ